MSRISTRTALWLTLVLIAGKIAAQTVIVPSGNPDEYSDRKPVGSYYGYERTHALYLNSEIGNTGYITQVGFFLNAKSNPSESTPVVIRMKTTTAASLTAVPYATAIAGSQLVWSGNITSDMLVAGNWVTVVLNSSFNYTGDNLEIFVETNYGAYGDEGYYGKQFRQADMGSDLCQTWEDDLVPPTESGITTNYRPNVQLVFEPSCSGTPAPGNTVASPSSVCTNAPFVLSMSGIGSGGGYSYQWQSSTDGNTYSNISGATGPSYTTSQTAALYYQCEVTCNASGLTALSSELQVTMALYYECYCASYATTTEDSKIDSFSLSNISTGSDPFACESYTDYTATIGVINPGQPYTIHLVNGSCTGEDYATYAAVYIDLDHDAVFEDNNERVYSYGPVYELNGIPDATFFLPLTTLAGITGMRVVLWEDLEVPPSCGTYSRGETEDYLININAVPTCVSTNDPGLTLSTKNPVCLNESFTLSIENYQGEKGITYQWQSSTDGTNFSNISGATSFTYTGSQTAAKWYRCDVKCNGTNSMKSDTLKVSMAPFYACYCGSASLFDGDTKIDSVFVANVISGSDPAACQSYTDYSAVTAELGQGVATDMRIVNGSCSGEFFESRVAVYIDYDQNGSFEDAGELAFSYGPILGLDSIPVASIQVPVTADTGITGMRIIIQEGDSLPKACGHYLYGETEDYTVHIIQVGACQDPPTPGIATVSVDAACEDDFPVSVQLNLSDNSSGIGQTYQWEQSPDGSSWTPIAGATNLTHIVSASGTTHYRCQVTCGTTLPSQPAMIASKTVPVGNTYTDPILVDAFPFIHQGDNLITNCWTSNYLGTSPQPSPDVYYEIHTDTVGTLYMSTCNNTVLNTYFHLLDETGQHLFSVNNDGELCSGIYASDSFYVALENQVHYLVVEGSGTDQGTYELEITFKADFADAEQLVPGLPAVSIYPNPATSQITIESGWQGSGPVTLLIRNGLGQEILSRNAPVVSGFIRETITIPAEWANGMYSLHLVQEAQAAGKRFVLQR